MIKEDFRSCVYIFELKQIFCLILRPRLHGTGQHGLDIKLDSFKTNVALKLTFIYLITANHRKNAKYDSKITEIDVMHGYTNSVPCKRGLIVYIEY